MHLLRSPAPGKHAARSALRHLERAWKLADQMPELSIFLGITAEEESASALFHSLRRRRYQGAQFLNPKNHVHKTALHPFLLAVGRVMADFPAATNPRFVFDSELSPTGEELLRVRLTVKGPNGKALWVHPLPPLEFKVSVNGSVHDFGPELAELASEKNTKSIREYVKKLANRRNEALYASSHGIPDAENVRPFLQYRKSVMISHFMAYLLVDPHAEHQLFVQQTLAAFVAMLGILPSGSEI